VNDPVLQQLTVAPLADLEEFFMLSGYVYKSLYPIHFLERIPRLLPSRYSPDPIAAGF